MMRRRTFIDSLARGLFAMPLVATAKQAERLWRIGYLSGTTRPPDGAPPGALRQALRELGYIDGENATYLGRWAEAENDRLPTLAAELISLKVDLIVTVGNPAAEAAKRATSSIPIVMAVVGDAVDTGLIESFARPGGNVTGITDQSADLSAKRLELLKAAVPMASHVAVLWNAGDPAMTYRYHQIEKAAGILHVTVQPLGVGEPNDFGTAFTAMTHERPDALLMVTDALTVLNRKRVIEFAATQRIPAMYEYSYLVRDGGMMSYGSNNNDDHFRRAAVYVDKIFKGAQPSELPAEQPTRFYFFVNLRTAKSLGLTIPQSVLLRADEVIQ